MQWAQEIRRLSASWRYKVSRLRQRFGVLEPAHWPLWGRRALAAIGLALILYYPFAMLWHHKIDDDLDFAVPDSASVPGASQAVAMTAALIHREVDQNGWVANNPFFMPSAFLDNMPNYQMGMIGALARFSFELADQIGRTRGSSQTDPDLQDASGLLQYSGTRWFWDPTVSLMPTAPSEDQYRKAREALLSYNRRLAAGEAVFERRADNLQATLDRIALDIGSSSAALDTHIAQGRGRVIDMSADDLFYGIKGQMYGYYMVLKALRADFAPTINERSLQTAYDNMLQSFAQAVRLDPWVVVNGAPDSQFFPSHLAAQGFYLLRARTQLREITSILQK